MQVWKDMLTRLNSLKTGGFTTLLKLTGAQVGVTSAAYTSGVVLGTTSPIKVELFRSQSGTGILQSLCVQDLSKQSGIIDFLFFDSLPSATTFTNNVALDVADADLPKIIGVASVLAADYTALADSSVAIKNNIGLVLRSDFSPYTQLYVVPLSRDTKTYVANELSFTLGILQD